MTKRWTLFNRNDYATFIFTVFENVYMVKTSSRPRIEFGLQAGSGTGARHPKAQSG